eukprot:12899690-Prorocentrum_lima.AAC.1
MAGVVVEDAAALVARCRGEVLRELAVAMDQHFNGLQQASRVAEKAGFIQAGVAPKLANIDICYQIVRHVTAPSVHA